MLKIEGKNIEITRGNVLPLAITAGNDIDDTDYEFEKGDILRFKIYDSKDVNKIYLQKDFKVEENAIEVILTMTAGEMTIGDLSNRQATYWWEVDLNPETDNEETIIGCELTETEELNPAIIVILPEGGIKDQNGGDVQ